jgi:hypothetical protein
LKVKLAPLKKEVTETKRIICLAVLSFLIKLGSCYFQNSFDLPLLYIVTRKKRQGKIWKEEIKEISNRFL